MSQQRGILVAGGSFLIHEPTPPRPASRVQRMLPPRHLSSMLWAACVGLTLAARLVASEAVNAPHPSPGRGWAQAERGSAWLSTVEVPPSRHNGEVWCFEPGEDGQLWLGSDELLLFDGRSVEKIPLPSGTYAVRGLARDRTGRLWVGAIDEIGYLEQEGSGHWFYRSIKESLRVAGVANLGNVWRAVATGEGVVFVADQQIVRVQGDEIEHWALPSPLTLLSSPGGGSLWIYQSGIGLHQMRPAGPELVATAAELPQAVVLWCLAPDPTADAAPTLPELIGTDEGVYVRSGREWKKLLRLSAALSEQLQLHAARIDAHTFAIGTYLGGLVIATDDDEILARIDRSGGVPNDSITGLWFDGRRTLWAGHPGGATRIEAAGGTSLFDQRNSPGDPALEVIRHGDRTFILSRRMLARVESAHAGQPARATHHAHLPLPLSSAASIHGALWLSGFGGGLWRLQDDQPTAAMPTGGFIFGLHPLASGAGSLIVLRDTRIESLSVSPSPMPRLQSAIELGSYPINLVRDHRADLWVATVTNGVMHLRCAPGPDGHAHLELLQHFRDTDLASPTERLQLTTVAGRVFLFNEATIMRFDEAAGRFVDVPELSNFRVLAAAADTLDRACYWVVRLHGADDSTPPALLRVSFSAESGRLEWDPLETPPLDSIGRINFAQIVEDGSVLWIAGSQRLLRLSVPHLSPARPPPAVSLRKLERNDTALALAAGPAVPEFAADTTLLRIRLAGVSQASGDFFLVQASLGGLSDQWSRPQSSEVFSFTGLRPGSYTFRARTVDRFGRTGPERAYAFRIAAPWYQRPPAVAVYVLVSLLLLFSGVRWRLRHLHRQNEKLNQIVDERTRELARANLVKNEFLENISHEIRNPLNGIANLVDLLRDAQLPAEERRLAQSLGRSTEHLKRVFSDVLGYTKLEYGHVQVSHAPFSLCQLLGDVIALHGIEARESHTELRLVLPEDFEDGFRGDADKLRAIVANYVGNALKYAPAKPVDVMVRATHNTDVGRTDIWIGVLDRGPGLSAEEQARLFEKFSRGESAKARGISGTGLGLAMCRGLAELMDGQTGVESRPGDGATFWVNLPLEPAPLPISGSSPHSPTTPASPAPGARALIVDDQEYNQTVLRGIVRRLGYVADVASHAGEVWPQIDAHSYSTVFLDWELPGLNGGEIARCLREHPHTQDAVIVATTAHDSDDIRQQCLEAQMDGFALKPFDTARLQQILVSSASRRARFTPAAGKMAEGLVVASGTTAPDGLDLEAFRYFGDGDPAHAREAVTLYLATLAAELASLQDAAAQGHREAGARAAHRLRSHASIVNGADLAAVAQQVVTAARNPGQADWTSPVTAVALEAEALRQAILQRTTTPPEAA